MSPNLERKKSRSNSIRSIPLFVRKSFGMPDAKFLKRIVWLLAQGLFETVFTDRYGSRFRMEPIDGEMTITYTDIEEVCLATLGRYDVHVTFVGLRPHGQLLQRKGDSHGSGSLSLDQLCL